MTQPMVTSWSYSRYSTYDKCPLQFRLKFIDKMKTAPSEAMARGNRVHQEISQYLKTPDKSPFPTGFEHHHDMIKQIVQFDDKVVEQQWGYDRQWKPTGWFSKGKNATWLRSILDVGLLYEDRTAEAVDWKTGKKRGSYEDQMEIFAISVFQRVQDCTNVTTRLAFLDTGEEAINDIPRTQLEPLIQKWNQKVQPMFEDTEFLAKPNDMCKFCDFARSAGGQCRYG